MEEPNNDIDTETLQAQIDLSMAYAHNLVASWLAPPSSSSFTQSLPSSSPAAVVEAELQALLRRPPRLGVGAPLPETPAPAQMRLVQKLEAGKTRSRNMENGELAETATATATAAMVNGRSNGREGEDSAEEESRVASTSAVRKRPRVADPFEPGGGKSKKRVKKAAAATAVENTETGETAEAVEGAVPAKDVAAEEAPSMVASVDAATSPNSKKRKKRKKKKNMETEMQLLPEGESEGQGVQGPVAGLGHVDEPRPAGRDAEGSARSHSAVPPDVDAMASPKPPRGWSPSVLSVRQFPTTLGPSTRPARSPPILNLTGLLPPAPEEPEGSPHKKRRRKRKKKKSTGEQGAEKDPP